MLRNILKMCEDQGVQLEPNAAELIVTFDEYPSENLLELLKKHKVDLLKYLTELNEEQQNIDEVGPLINVNRDINRYELSFPQQRLWIIDQLEGGGSQYNLSAAIHFEGPLDASTAEKALFRIIKRHEPLRTVFRDDHGVKQVILDHFDFTISHDDLSDLEPVSREKVLKSAISSEVRKPFDLSSDLLLRAKIWKLTETSGVFVINMHHIASDGWSLGILVNEFRAHYQAIAFGKANSFQPLDIQYIDFAQWQRCRLSSGALKNHISYWHNQLANLPKIHSLPLDKPRPKTRSFSGKSYTFSADAKLTSSLKKLAYAEQVTLFMVLHGAFSLLLSVYSNETDISIGTPVANRLHPEVEGLIGFFANTIILRTDIEESAHLTVSEYLQYIKEVNLDAQANQEVPFEHLVEQLNPERDTSYNPLFQIMFSMNNTRQNVVKLQDILLTPVSVENATAKFDLSLEAAELNDEITFIFEYSTDIFYLSTIHKWAESLIHILRKLADSSCKKVCDLELVTDNEYRYFLTKQDCIQKERPRNVCMHHLVEAQVDRTPDSVALVFENNSVSYRELNERANQLAHCLIEKGVVADTLVGVFADRSVEMVIALLAILKAGGAYVPLEPGFPEARLQFMLEDSRVALVLTQSSLVEAAPLRQVECLCVDDAALFQGYPTTNPASTHSYGLSPFSLAYVIYTSGSTGQPKGVMIEHDALVNRIDWMQREYNLQASDKVLQKTPYSFDVSVWEFFWPLATGAQLVIARAEGHKDPAYLTQLIQEAGVTTLHFVPAMFRAMLSDGDWASCHSVRQVFCSGEALSSDIVKGHYQVHQASLHNLYGPTEATIDVSYWACQAEDVAEDAVGNGVVPIGKPIQNTQLYVMNAQAKLLPRGAIGELYIGGEGLARGYLNRPELTGQRFIADPFQKKDSGRRLYKTGDLVRMLADGNLAYTGRVDNQVKINGLRIELDEIKEQLIRVEGVDTALVVIRDGTQSAKIVAYVVPVNPSLASRHAAESLPARNEFVAALEKHLRRVLPVYMQPSDFVLVETIPLTFNGKVDYKALPDAVASVEGRDNYLAPRTELEKQLCEIWSDLLKVERVGITDNFFSLGGDSILSIQVISRMNKLGASVDTVQFFENQTIKELVQCVGKKDIVKPTQIAITGKQLLLPIQQRFLSRDSVDKHYFNQSILLYPVGHIGVESLQEIIAYLYKRHDVFRLSFKETEKGWISEYNDFDENILEHIFHLYDVKGLDDNRYVEAIAEKCNQLHAGLSLEKGLLFKAAYFNGDSGKSRLFLVFHHLVVDGVSFRILLQDIEKACSDLKNGNEIIVQEKTSSYKEWGEFLYEYAQDDETQNERIFWEHQLRNADDQLPVDHHVEHIDSSNSQHVLVHLGKEETRALLEGCHSAYRTTINDLLLSALLISISEWSGKYKVNLDLEGHGRDSLTDKLDITGTVGWFTNVFPVCLSTGPGVPLSTTIKAVKEQLRAIPRKGIGYGLLRYMAENKGVFEKGKPEILFNYLGHFDQGVNGKASFGIATENTGSNNSKNLEREYLIDFIGMISNGVLSFKVDYSGHQYLASTIENLASGFKSALRSVIQHCQSCSKSHFTPSDFPLAKTSISEVEQLQENYSAITDLYPSTSMQQGMLYHSQKVPGAYVNQLEFHLAGKLDVNAFKSAWSYVIKKHEVFRTVFVGSQLHQLVLSEVEIPWFEEDLSDKSEIEQEQYIREFCNADKRKGFDFRQAPLMRLSVFKLSDKRYKFLWSVHHAIIDGWSIPIVFSDIAQSYHSYLDNKRPELEIKSLYKQYIRWLQQQDLNLARKFWLDYLQDFSGITDLGLKRKSGDEKEGPKKVSLKLSELHTHELKSLAQTSMTTLSTVVQAAWGYLLHYYSGNEKIVFGETISGRPPSVGNIEEIVGLFINSLPVCLTIKNGQTIHSWLNEIHRDSVARNENSYFSLAEIQKLCNNGQNIFDTLVVFENYPVADQVEALGAEMPELVIENVISDEQTNYGLTLVVAPADSLELELRFNADEYEESYMVNLIGHLQVILEKLVAPETQTLQHLSLLTKSEENQLFNRWLDFSAVHPDNSCIHEIFEQQVERTPDAIAIAFNEEQLSYRQLNSRANQVAHAIGVLAPNTLVGVLLNRSLDLIIGLLGILKSGGAYVPLDPGYPDARLVHMIEDSNIGLVLTQQTLRERLPVEGKQTLVVDDRESLENYSIENPKYQASMATSSNLAYVMYTSGSTGTPKGVMVSHNNVLRLTISNNYAPLNQETIILSSSSPSFDASTFEYWGTLLNGGKLILYPESILDINVMNRLLVCHKVNTLWLTAGVFEMWSSQLPRTDCIRWVIAGGDVLSPTAIKRVYEFYNEIKIVNGYGPTENTTFTCAYIVPRQFNFNLSIPIGRPIKGTCCYVLNSFMDPVPIGVVGELYVSGDGVSLGYMNKPELSREKFLENPFSNHSAHGKLYRTGDLVRYQHDGNLEFVGRHDRLVKIRGYRIELHEIENQISQLSYVKLASVVAIGDNFDRKILAYVVVNNRHINTQENIPASMRASLRQLLPDYMVPSVIVVLDELPLTPNGKVDKTALEALHTPLQYDQFISPATPTEEKLCEIWADLLNLEKCEISANANFFELGGHSLLAMRMVFEVIAQFAVELSVLSIFESPELSSIAKIIDESEVDSHSGIVPIERSSTPLLLSFSQQRLWFVEQLEAEKSQYNIPVPLYIRGKFDVLSAEFALKRIIERHEPLRTTFVNADPSPLQIIKQKFDFTLEKIDLSDVLNQEENVKEYVRNDARTPFNLNDDLMIRASFLILSDDVGVLLLNFHHIAVDGWSLTIIVNEFVQHYEALKKGQLPSLPPLGIQYVDYASSQRRWLHSEEFYKQFEYWVEQLQSLPEVHGFPLDRPRPEKQSFDGGMYSFALSKKTSDALNQIAKRCSSTLFMLLHGAFSILLARHSNRNDIVVGTSVANRPNKELIALIGMFVNTLVLRVDCKKNESFMDFLSKVKRVNIEAQANQSMPFEYLIEKLKPARNPQYPPLFQIMFNMNTNEMPKEIPSDFIIEDIEREELVSKYELTLSANVTNQGIQFSLEYRRDLFNETTIKNLAHRLLTLLEGIGNNPDEKIYDLPMLDSGEIQDLLSRNKSNHVEHPTGRCFHELFEFQVVKTPSATAIVYQNQSISYSDLNRRANQLANYLLDMEVGVDTLVGLFIDRSIELIVSLLAVLKAGAAYVPFESHHPKSRLEYMVENSKIEVLLTQSKYSGYISRSIKAEVLVDSVAFMQQLKDRPHENIVKQRELSDNSLAYVIYTSGSTGRPKGVMTSHANLCSYIFGIKDRYKIAEGLNYGMCSTVATDLGNTSLFVGLLSGGELHIIADDLMQDPLAFSRYLLERNINVLKLTPSHFNALFDVNTLKSQFSCKWVFLGGERIVGEVKAKIKMLLHGGQTTIVNHYGPTESTIGFSTCTIELSHLDGNIPIGYPLPNRNVYILGENGQLAPNGVVGELCVGGSGVARGYLNQSELSRDKFVQFSLGEGCSDRIYKTGDLVRYREDGSLAFIGRVDDQVKVRGFRIELGEIIHHLSRYEGITGTVIARRDKNDEDTIVAYITAENKETLSDSELINSIRNQLSLDLPNYMIPSTFIILPELPLTANGKIDYERLPSSFDQSTHQRVAPGNATENILVEVWSDLLGLEQEAISTLDDVFNLGAHSLLLLKAVARLGKRGIACTLNQFYKFPAIKAFAHSFHEDSREPLVLNSLILLNDAKKGKPLYILHPLSGRADSYSELAQLLEDVCPVYGVQAPFYFNHNFEFDTLLELARYYTSAIKLNQPVGPYKISGWSAGGALAYLVSYLLTREGEKVEHFSVIDGYITDTRGDQAEPQFRYLLHVLNHVCILSNYDGANLLKELEQILPGKNYDEQFRIVTDVMIEEGLNEHLTKENLIIGLKFGVNFWKARWLSVPIHLPGKSVLFLASEGGLQKKITQEWEKCILSSHDIVSVSGEHNTLMEGKSVIEIANKLRADLDELSLSRVTEDVSA